MAPDRRSAVRAAAAGSGSLQGGQRHAGPSGRRHLAAADRPTPAGRGAGDRPGGSPRRRRIRGAAARTPTPRAPRRSPRISSASCRRRSCWRVSRSRWTPASASPSHPSTVRMPIRCCAARTSPCIRPSAQGRAWRSTAATEDRHTARPPGVARRAAAAPSNATSCSCTTSPSWTCATARWSASRRWCAGSIRSAGSCRRASSSRWPSRPG